MIMSRRNLPTPASDDLAVCTATVNSCTIKHSDDSSAFMPRKHGETTPWLIN